MVKLLKNYTALKSFISDNPVFSIHNNKLYCDACNVKKKYNPKQGIRFLKRHLLSKLHCENVNLGRNQTRLQNVINTEKFSTFDIDLYSAMISSNIPPYKLRNLQFRIFLENYTRFKIKDESYYR